MAGDEERYSVQLQINDLKNCGVRREEYILQIHLSNRLRIHHESQVRLIRKFSRLYSIVANSVSTEFADLAASTHDGIVILRYGHGMDIFWSVLFQEL